MKRLWLFGALAGLLLGSASPPEQAGSTPPSLPYAIVDCAPAVGYSCDPVAPAAPPPVSVSVASEPLGKVATPAVAESNEAEADVDLVAAAPEPEDSASGLKVLISLPEQKAYVFEDGELLATSRVSTGKPGHRTPVGTFHIMQKKVHHHSSKYDNAPMPFMQRLTSYGIALHAGHLPGYPASHGCIRLPRSFAKKLYGLTDVGTKVTVTNKRPKSAEDALRLT